MNRLYIIKDRNGDAYFYHASSSKEARKIHKRVQNLSDADMFGITIEVTK